MVANVLIRTGDESVTLTAQAVRRLLDRGDGDAALLYLALLRHQGTVLPRSLAGELRWDRGRIEAAEAVLRELGLVAPAAADLPPEPADERPAYDRADVAERLEKSGEFRTLTAEVERKLGKKLTTPDVGVLLGLNDYLGLPADVIYLLVCHCIERAQQRFGPGRRPTLRQIEKEGAYWARLGICDQDSAGRYLSDYARKREKTAAYMQALQLGSRPPVDSEQRYILDWIDMGFTPETVALAYDKTVFYKQGLNWRYLNGILRRWHQQGWHTAEEVAAGERRGPKKGGKPDGGKTDWMDEYL